MNIYIYDDDPAYRHQLAALMEQLAGMDARIRAVGTRREMERLIQSSDGYTLFLLDIVDESGNDVGFYLAEQIKKHHPSHCIAFITGYIQRLVLSSRYKLLADTFICKGIGNLKQELDTLLEFARSKEGGMLHLKGKWGKVYQLPFRDVILFETVKRKRALMVYHEHGELLLPVYLKEILPQLDGRFVRCHRGCVVNRSKIREIDTRERLVTLSNGKVCPYSKRAKEVLLDALF